MHTQYQRMLDAVVAAYIEAIYFTETGGEDQPAKDMPLTLGSYLDCVAQCAAFMVECDKAGLLCDYINANRTMESFGHDFWLTRNRHGAGFWDRGLGELGNQLSGRAKMCGSVNVDADDNGEICVY
jgi:hypothetical protein